LTVGLLTQQKIKRCFRIVRLLEGLQYFVGCENIVQFLVEELDSAQLTKNAREDSQKRGDARGGGGAA